MSDGTPVGKWAGLLLVAWACAVAVAYLWQFRPLLQPVLAKVGL